MMQRARREHVPRIPESLQELQEILGQPRWQAWSRDRKGNSFFTETVAADDGSHCTVWVSSHFGELLTRGPWRAYADATFKSVPLDPPCEQLFSLHVIDEEAHGQRKQVNAYIFDMFGY